MQGKIPYKVLQINSTFHGYMEVTQVIFQPQDSRFYFQPHNPHTVLLKPQEASIVSMKLLKICLNDCLFSYCIGSYWKTWLHEIKEFLCTSYLFLPFHQLLALVCMCVQAGACYINNNDNDNFCEWFIYKDDSYGCAFFRLENYSLIPNGNAKMIAMLVYRHTHQVSLNTLSIFL